MLMPEIPLFRLSIGCAFQNGTFLVLIMRKQKIFDILYVQFCQLSALFIRQSELFILLIKPDGLIYRCDLPNYSRNDSSDQSSSMETGSEIQDPIKRQRASPTEQVI